MQSQRRTPMPRPLALLTTLAAVSALPVILAAQDGPVPTTLPALNEYTIHVMPQSHMDPVWRWRVYEGRDFIHDTFAQAVRFVDERPDFVFNQSSAWMFETIERSDRELFARIAQAVRSGRWCIVGGTWVESDQNMPNGEALVRQHLYGQRYFREKFGVTAQIGWNVDAFGHAWSLPQIMRKAGLWANVITRCGPAKVLSEWTGPDGSSVTCVDARAIVNEGQQALAGIQNPAQVFTIVPRLQKALQNIGLKHLCFGTVVGDHGGGPTRRELAMLDSIAKMPNMPKIVLDRADRALEAMKASAATLPVHRDQMNYTYEGCYSSQVEIKRRNRMNEQWLTSAEKACTLASIVAEADYPKTGLQRAWKLVLFNQFHDILPGTSIRRAYDDVDATYDRAEDALQKITKSALSGLAESLDTRGAGQPVMVYNPLSWRRADLAWVILDYKTIPTTVRVRDAAGNIVPGQVLSHMKIYESFERCRIAFIAQDVPSLGTAVYWVEALSGTGRPLRVLDHFSVPVTEELYKAYREKGTYWHEGPLPKADDDNAAGLTTSETTLENDFYRITFDRPTGHVTNLTDKRSERDLIPAGQTANRLVLIDESPDSDAWNQRLTDKTLTLDRPTQMKVVATGPVLATMHVAYAHGDSVFEQRVTLYNGLDRIDMTNQTEWRQRLKTLKVFWPFAIETDDLTWEIPYAWIRKPADGREIPAQRWVDLSSEHHGISVLNDGRYGHNCERGEIGITLLRSSIAPDPMADVGQHAVTYCVWPHTGPWDPAQTVRRAAELNAPLMTRAVESHPGKHGEISLLAVDAANAVVAAVKQAYDDEAWVVRVWETSGKLTPVTLKFCYPLASAEETDLLEDRVGPANADGNALKFDLRPHEIKTFRITLP